MYQRTTIFMIFLLLVTFGYGSLEEGSAASTSTQRQIGWVILESSHSPDPRTGHAMAMLTDGLVLLFAGQDTNSNVLGDMWFFGPETIFKSAAPEDGVRPALHVDFGNRPSTFGRYLATFPRRHLLSPAHILADWTPITPPDSPSARQGHSMVTLQFDIFGFPAGTVLLFGGTDNQGAWFNDLHVFAADKWSPITPANDPPSGRANHIAWVFQNRMYVQGGQGKRGLVEDLWRYDLLSNTWQQLQNPPDFISPHAHPIIYGDNAYFVDAHLFPDTGGTLYSFDMVNEQWGQQKLPGDWPPGQRGDYMMVQVDGKAYMLGGRIWDPDTQTLNYTAEVWILDMTTFIWTQLEDMPYPIAKEEAVYDPYQQSIIVWGGRQSDSVIFPGNKTLIYYFEQSPVEQFPTSDIPSEFILMQNYPNPFNPQTTIEYQLSKKTHVLLTVSDIRGREVLTIVKGEQPQGHYQIKFDSHNLTSGTYFYQLETDDQTLCKRMLILK